MAEKGFKINVVCPLRDGQKRLTSFKDGIVVNRVKPIAANLFYDFDYWKKNKLPRLLKLFKPLLGYPRWIVPALKKVWEISNGSESNILYTINNPLTLHLIGLFARKKFDSWIVELRDPITNYEFSNRGELGHYVDGVIESLVIKYSDLITLRHGLQVKPKDLKEKYPAQSEKIKALPDYGVDLNDFKDISKKSFSKNIDLILGVYAGSFYGDVPIAELNEALKQSKKNIKIEILGEDWSSTEWIKFNGRVPYETVLDYYKSCNFTIVFEDSSQDSVENDFIPSKMSELIALRKPIFCIGNKDSKSATIIEKNNLGVISDPNVEDIKKGLLQIQNMLVNGSFNGSFFETCREQISNERCERAFLELIYELEK